MPVSVSRLALLLLGGAPVQSSLPVDHFGHFLPVDHVRFVRGRLASVCFGEPQPIAQLLITEEALQEKLTRNRDNEELLVQLGCVRGMLAASGAIARGGAYMSTGTSWALGAISPLLRALAQRPEDSLAAQALTLVALGTGSPTRQAVLAPEESGLGKSAIPWGPVANALYASIRAGVHESGVLRGCASYLLDAGDVLSARDCSLRGLANGADSSWHLLRLSYVASVLGDSLLAASEFELAIATANTPGARREVGWQLNIRFADASWIKPSGFVLDSLSPRVMAEWLGLEDSLSRVKWWRARVDQLVAKTGKSFASILQTHFENLTYERGSFHDCHFIVTSRPNILAANRQSIPCLAEQDPEIHEIGLAVRYYRLWEPASGAPVNLVTFAIPLRDIVTAREDSLQIATLEFDLRARGGTENIWVDSTVSRRYRELPSNGSSSALTGMFELHFPVDVRDWSVLVSQGQNRRAVEFGLDLPPVGDGPLNISDIIIGSWKQKLRWSNMNDSVPLLPLPLAGHGDSLNLFMQIRSAREMRSIKWALAVHRVKDGAMDSIPAIKIVTPLNLRAGINPIERGLDVSRLGTGEFRVLVSVTDGEGKNVTRSTSLRLN